MGGGTIAAGLNEAQAEAVQSSEGPVLILAGAGTGKTRTVIFRIANLLERGVDPRNILAVTFTNKAACEMRERVGEMVRREAAEEMTVCTFHSLCVRVLRVHAGLLGYNTNFSIAAGSDRDGLVKQLIVQHGGAKEKIKAWDITAAVSRQKNAGMSLGEIPDDLVRTVAMSYQRELRARNALDFDDLLVLAEQVLREHREARDFWRERFRYVTVDEFQDTNGLQMDLLMQYAGLGLFVIAEAVVFLPLLLMAASPRFLNAPDLIGQAGMITAAMFAGLTFIAFSTKKDFSFLGGVIKVGFLVAVVTIVLSLLMGFSLGLLFSGAMVLLAAISILWSTSNIIHHYGTEQYVAASLGLFASVAMLFFYVLRILMILRGSD